MIKFTKPEKLNGIQLVQELADANIEVIGNPVVDADNSLLLNIADADKKAAEAVIEKHVGQDYEPTIEDKLASVGLNLNDLKSALGI